MNDNKNEIQEIERAQKDVQYFDVLYNRYFQTIFRFIFKRLSGDETFTADLTQQVFIKAMLNIGKYKDMGFPFSSWLFRIAQNEINLEFRKHKKVKEVGIERDHIMNLVQDLEEDHDFQISNEDIITNLNMLDEEHADLIELRYFLQMSYKEIGEIYNIPEVNARMTIFRILKKIKKNWRDERV